MRRRVSGWRDSHEQLVDVEFVSFLRIGQPPDRGGQL
jgi:hypothetical protein